MPGLFLFCMETELSLLAEWLDTPNYDQGVLLYQKLIGKGFLLTMLMKGADDYNRAKLHEALKARHDQLDAELKARKAAYPDQLTEQLAGAGRLMDERVVLKEQMRSLWLSGTSQGDELQQKAFRVLAITGELDGIYGQKDFFHAHGYMPDEDVVVSQLTDAELIARRNTLRTAPGCPVRLSVLHRRSAKQSWPTGWKVSAGNYTPLTSN